MYSEAFYEAAQACGREFGKPLPKRLLTIGDADEGWHVKFNPTSETLDDISPFSLMIAWNGCPAGLIGPRDGVFAAGGVANEGAFIEWAKGLTPTATRQGA